MKKITIYIVMALLCPNFGAVAQENKAVDVTAKGIQIGQKVPDVTIINLHNYKNANGKPDTTAKISDFKGKLLILDFWATWCSPCIAMIPKIDSLQKAFGDKIQFLSVTYQNEKEVMPFLEKFEKQREEHYDLPVVTGDKELHQLFPHVYLPHYVWIDGKGTVKAITAFGDVNEKNIISFLKSGNSNLDRKNDLRVDYDYKTPLFLNKEKEISVKTQSVLTGYMDGYGAVSSHNVHVVKPGITRKITATNMSMIRLYQIALGKGTLKYSWKKTIVEVKDTSKVLNWTSGDKYRQWLNYGNGFCYELIVSENMLDPFQVMEQDLNRYFTKYTITVEKRTMDVLVLKRTSDVDHLRSKGESPQSRINATGCTITNKNLSSLNSYINTYIHPVVDETNYKGNVDISINADMNNIKDINLELSRYDLIYSKETRELEFLVVKDKAPF